MSNITVHLDNYKFVEIVPISDNMRDTYGRNYESWGFVKLKNNQDAILLLFDLRKECYIPF